MAPFIYTWIVVGTWLAAHELHLYVLSRRIQRLCDRIDRLEAREEWP